MKRILLLAFVFLSFFCTKAQEGLPDPSFGMGGYVNLPRFSHTAFQKDGKLVSLQYSGGALFYTLYRYNLDGTPDASFGSGGKVEGRFTSFVTLGYYLTGVIKMDIQNGEKIVVYGMTRRENANQLALARYNPDGTRDLSFGGGGSVQVREQVSPFSLFGHNMVAANNGTIIYVLEEGHREFFTYHQTYPLNAPRDPINLAQVRFFKQSDGSILIAGFHSAQMPNAFVRYKSDLTRDYSLGVNGIVAVNGPIGAMTAQPDGKIIVQIGFELMRFNTNGSLDPTFGTGGVLQQPFPANQLLVQADGKILAGGRYLAQGAGGHFLVARYNPDGSFDGPFGYGGMTAIAFGPSPVDLRGMTIANNRLYLEGQGNGPGYLAAIQLSSQAQSAQATLTTMQGIAKAEALKMKEQKLSVAALQNPATNHFTLRIAGSNREPVQVRIIDALGRTVEVRRNVAANSTLQLGSAYKPGLYYAEIIQGSEKKTTKLIKGAK